MRTRTRIELEALMDALSQYIENSDDSDLYEDLSARGQRMLDAAKEMLRRVEIEFAGRWD